MPGVFALDVFFFIESLDGTQVVHCTVRTFEARTVADLFAAPVEKAKIDWDVGRLGEGVESGFPAFNGLARPFRGDAQMERFAGIQYIDDLPRDAHGIFPVHRYGP